MAYEKLNLTNGTVLDETHLAHMEQGIETAAKAIVSVGSDTLTWDGNTEGLVVTNALGIPVYKVSDAALTLADFSNGCTSHFSNGQSYTMRPEEAQEDENFIFFSDVGLVSKVNVPEEGLFVGVYFALFEGMYTASLTIPGYTGFTQEKINPKLLSQTDWNQTDDTAADFLKNRPFGDEVKEILPETAVVGEDDGEGGFFCMLDASLFHSDSEPLLVTFDGVKYECVPNIGFGTPMFGNAAFVGGADTGEPFMLIIALANSVVSLVVADTKQHTVKVESVSTQKIKPKYVDAVTNFYISYGEDIYLYKDALLTTKVTAIELTNAAKSSAVQIIVSALGAAFSVLYPVSVPLVAPDGYSEVSVLDGQEQKTYYTAEYEPTT